MNDDELTERLAETLRAEASTVTSPPDGWERFTAAGRVVPMRPRRMWLTAPAGAVGIAAAIALVVLLVQSGGSTNLKASSSAGPAAALAPAASSSLRAGSSSGAGSAPGAGSSSSGAVSSASGAAVNSPSAAGAAGPAGFGTAGGPGPAGGPVPAGFEPASVTFVSPMDGWALGTAPCGSPPCTSVVRTTDGGATWVGIPAPADALSAPEAPAGVTEIRFATPLDGWAYGPDLWATHDGGATWHQVSLGVPGPVSALEASDGRVYAAAFDQNSADVQLFGSPIGSDNFSAVPVSVPIGAGPVPSTQIVLQGSSGWMIEIDRTVVGGARMVNGQWASWTPPCATVEGPALLAASSASDLVAACDVGLWGGSSSPAERLFLSQDGGTTFTEAPSVVPTGGGSVEGIATLVPGTIAEATSGSLYLSSDGGSSWVQTSPGQDSMWVDLGFTTPAQGVVVHSGSALLMTHDGGHTWAPVTF
jgi:photosystem II stability/assembly factor-like uncharacterized protein